MSTNETKIKTDQLNATILHLTNNLLNINETLLRAVQWVAEDQKKDHEMLVLLQETSQNVSMKVISLERECVKSSVLTSVEKLNDQVNDIYAANTKLSEKMKQLEQSYGDLKNSTNIMVATMPEIHSQKLSKDKVLEKSFVGELTTEPDRSVLVSDDVSVKKSTGKPKLLMLTP